MMRHRLRLRAASMLPILLIAGWVSAGVAAAQTPAFQSSPPSGSPGTTITAWYGTPCPPPAPGATVTVALTTSGGAVIAQASAPVYPGGQWYLTLAVPANAPAGTHVLSARCSTPAGTYLTYGPRSFTVTGGASTTSTSSTSSTTTSTTSTSTSTTTTTTTTTTTVPPALPPVTSAVPISADPFVNRTSQHQTQVEPDTFAFGSTIVSAFQSGRFYDGGASDIGWATSTDGGTAWAKGFLPSLTPYSTPTGPWARVSDPSVAYDPRHQVWVISALGMQGNRGVAVTVSRSTDGLSWSAPVVAAATSSSAYDKNWIVCDDHAASPFYGNCYVTFDDNGVGNRLLNTTSTDGGLTWGPLRPTADNAFGLGGQPLVQPSGVVVVPVATGPYSAIGAYRSVDGGQSWTGVTTISSISRHLVAGPLRAPPLPSAGVDGGGRVYVVWSDCRFRTSCRSNDIVLSTSTDGVNWSAVARVPIDPATSTVDHFVPGLGVDPSSSGPTARLALTYYFYPNASCSVATCQLYAGAVSSTDGGGTWSTPVRFNAVPMALAWIANTTQGYMVGDYISTSFTGGRAVGVFALATAPEGTLREAMYAGIVP